MRSEKSRGSVKKIALLGNTGVGKGTFANLLEEMITDHRIHRLKLARPLYDAQESVYRLCGIVKPYEVQDGELLNFLGAHMRKINPKVLENSLKARIKDINEGIIVCDDARPKDVGYLKELGFVIIEILATPRIAEERRKLRGDLTLGSSKHSNKIRQRSSECDFKVINESTLDDFRNEVHRIAKAIL
jgi:dephospho-CoA kinase